VTNNKQVKKAGLVKSPLPVNVLIIALVVVFLARIFLTYLPSHKIDIGVLKWEIGYLADNPLKNFDKDVHFVYGPVYAYCLWIAGEIVKAFSLGVQGQEFMIKIWAVLFDLIAAVFVYLIGRKYNKERLGLVLAALYALNPAIVFNSSVWGQFDGITAALFIAVIYFFNIKKTNIALFAYAVAALTKPQSIALFPIVAILYFRDFPWSKFKEYFKTKDKGLLNAALKKTFSKLGIGVLGCLVIYTVLLFPFYSETPSYTVNQVKIYDQDMKNVSENKKIDASSTLSERYKAFNVTDGNDSTYWSPDRGTTQWMSFDLGTAANIGSVEFKWGFEYAKKYSIQVSDDSRKWSTVYTKNNGKGKDETVSFNPAKARFVKVQLEERPFPYGLIKIESDSGAFKKAAFKSLDFYYWLMHHYQKSLDDYPYATANAFNLWTIFGKQTVHDSTPFLFGISCGTWGYIFLFFIVWFIGSLLILVKKKSVLALYYTALFITSGMFVFTSRVHERYLLPAIIFATICIFWDKLMLIPTIIYTGACLANQWYVYYIQNKNPNAPWISIEDSFSHLVAWVTLIMMLCSMVYLFYLAGKKGKKASIPNVNKKKPLKAKE
jgi:Gpi18-like mannosyltransferase